MHYQRILHNLIGNVIHKKRLDTLQLMVSAAFTANSLSLTGLGRNIDLAIQERSGIRRADRFLGNKNLQEEYHLLCKQLATTLIGNQPSPEIIVDWTPIDAKSTHVLRAALVAQGRALTLYEEVHPKSGENHPKVHQNFLAQLAWVLPQGCTPIIITDAGFSNPWFKAVTKLKWYFVGRVRSTRKNYRLLGDDDWQTIDKLYARARTTSQHVGTIELAKKNPMSMHAYLVKTTSKLRHALNKAGKKRQDRTSKEKSAAAKDPWLLVTSLPHKSTSKKKIVKIYQQRMQIEEGIRDLKSTQYGFGFEHMKSKSHGRILVLLLIGMLASIITWMVGLVGEREGLHKEFQANSHYNKRILSLVYLGRRIIAKKKKCMKLSDIAYCIETIATLQAYSS